MENYSFYDFQKDFPDDDSCLDKIMEIRYEDTGCPKCGKGTKYYRIKGRKAYAFQCGHHVYPCKGTVFAYTKTPLHKWFYAMFLFSTSKNGVSTMELKRQLGVSYDCAFNLGHKIRQLMATLPVGKLKGHVEIDETYIGKKLSKKENPDWKANKTKIMGMKQRDGRIVTLVVPRVDANTLLPIIYRRVEQGSKISSDEWKAYKPLKRLGYKHKTVRHSAWQFADGDCHTNSLEGYWGGFKRSIRGTHVNVSGKYMPNYLAEFQFRHNTRNMTGQMFNLMLKLLR